jgi:hypothetical protein
MNVEPPRDYVLAFISKSVPPPPLPVVNQSLRTKSDFPPLFLTRTVLPISTLWLTALTMSYIASAATEAPVRASISTPVVCVTLHSHSIMAVLFTSRMSIFTTSSGRGWHRGIRSEVFLFCPIVFCGRMKERRVRNKRRVWPKTSNMNGKRRDRTALSPLLSLTSLP